MPEIFVEKLKESFEEKEVEMVERKGLGHPDTICDLVCEAASQALSQYYLKNFGKVLHHNLDKGVLIGGKSQPKFGGGKILEPIKIIIVGRATDKVGKRKINVEKIVKNAALSKLREIFKKKDIEKNFEIEIKYKPGAANLKQVVEEKELLANDTSFGAAFAPFSLTEKIALKTSQFLNSLKFPFLGPDIKVMVLRKKDEFSITIATAYIDRFVKSVSDYFEKKKILQKALEKFLKKFKIKKFQVFHNSADSEKATKEEQIYLTVLGSSAEQGDDGQVGRGNRVWGLICPQREMSLEAPAGKNINHPGKLYQILAFLIAKRIAKEKGAKECQVKILSQIGKPLKEPQLVSIKLKGQNFEFLKKRAIKIVNFYFENLEKIQREIVEGKYPIC